VNQDFLSALAQLEKEKGISTEILIETVEAALVSAYRRNFGSGQNLRIEISRQDGTVRVFAGKIIVEEVEDGASEISLAEAQLIDAEKTVGEYIENEITPKDFGRIAAQTAKQVVVQRIREAERNIIYDEFLAKESDIIEGIVQRTEGRNVFIDLGRTETVIAASEQIPHERLEQGNRVKVYIVEVRKTTKGPQVVVSRTHPGLLKRLFELEVPEIFDGIVEIKNVAREAGYRSKVAVHSEDYDIDPVGACVGARGMRVQNIVNELKGEKIDIIRWSEEPEMFIASSLSPARVLQVYVEPEYRIAQVVVPDNQLSLAIGKEGQNVRLAAKLTGWKIDIKSESQLAEYEEDFEDDDFADEPENILVDVDEEVIVEEPDAEE
jgi:N utilization substance protein A